MSVWLEFNEAFVGNTMEFSSNRTGEPYSVTFVRVPRGVQVDGRDVGGGEFSVFANKVHMVEGDESKRIIPIDDETLTLMVPVRDQEGQVVTEEGGKWVKEAVEVKATALRKAMRAADSEWRKAHPAPEPGPTLTVNKAFVGEPFTVERDGAPYQLARISIPGEAQVGGADLRGASIVARPSHIGVTYDEHGRDTGLRDVTLPKGEVTVTVPVRDAEGRVKEDERGHWDTERVKVPSDALAQAVAAENEKWRAAHRVVPTPAEARNATHRVIESEIADHDIDFAPAVDFTHGKQDGCGRHA